MAHVFDLADNWPADHVSLIVQGWYAIPTDDGGADEDYGVWNPGDQAAWHASNPSAYPANPYLIQDASTCNGGQRFIGSKLRPLTGLYSGHGQGRCEHRAHRPDAGRDPTRRRPARPD
jgi:hypothetical protein